MGQAAAVLAPPRPGILSRQQFLNLCSQANTKVDLAERQFAAWLGSITIAYAQAWTNHTNFLKQMELQAKLMNDLILNAAFAFLPGGVGGLIGDSMKRLGAGVFLIDSVKDLSKWGFRSGALVGVPGGALSAPQPAFKAFPADPLVWQSQISVRVQLELASVTRVIESWQNAVNTGDRRFEPAFNPVEKTEKALVLTPPGEPATPLASLTPVNISKLQTQFEAGFLAGWIDNHATSAFIHMSQAAWGGIFTDGVQDKIVKYATTLGIPNPRQRINDVISKGISEHNRRVIARKHGLI